MKKIKSQQTFEKTAGPGEIEGYFTPLQITLSHNMNFERAVKNFRSMTQADGILALHKEKSEYEKPSEKKRRKESESIRRLFEEEMKARKILSGEYEKEKQKKQAKKEQKLKQRIEAKSKES